MVDVPQTEVDDTPRSQDASSSKDDDAPRPTTVDLPSADAASIIESLLVQVIQGAVRGSPEGSQPAAEGVTPSVDVEMPDDPVKDRPSVAGGKRQRSQSRCHSPSPVNKDQQRDESPAAIDLPTPLCHFWVGLTTLLCHFCQNLSPSRLMMTPIFWTRLLVSHQVMLLP